MVQSEGGEGGRLTVAPLAELAQVTAAYALPSGCTRGGCEVEGFEVPGWPSPAGPVLVLSRASGDTQYPSDVWVGAPAGESFVFVPIWQEPHVYSDGSRVGPAFHLVPHVCGDQIGFLAARRLDGEGDQPTEGTLAAEGVPALTAEGEWISRPIPADERGRCKPVDLPLP